MASVRRKRSDGEDKSEKVRRKSCQRRSAREGPSKKVCRRASIGEVPLEKIRQNYGWKRGMSSEEGQLKSCWKIGSDNKVREHTCLDCKC